MFWRGRVVKQMGKCMVSFWSVERQPCQKLDGFAFRRRRMSALDAPRQKPPVVCRKLSGTANGRRRACYLRAMRYFIVSHNAALALLAHMPNPRFGDSEPEIVSIAGACALLDQEAQEVIDRYDLGIETLDLLVPSRADRRRSKHVKTHLCTNELPAGSFISLGHWMGDLDAYVCSPELAFLQTAHDGDAAAAIYAGYAMTSDYRLDNLAPGGVTSRDAGMRDGRLTTKELIAAYLDRASKVRGAAKAKALLPYVEEGSRSPRESGLCMFMSLPARYGGLALGKAELNKKYFIRDGYNDGRNRKLRVLERTPDITLTAKAEVGLDKVRAGLLPEVLTALIDYDSDAIHDGSEKIHKDAERRNELQLLNGVAYFTVTTDQASDYEKLVRLCERIRRKLHRRKRPIFYKPMTEEARYLAQARLETKRFKLWQTVIETHQHW